MIFLGFHKFLNTKAGLVVSDMSFFFFFPPLQKMYMFFACLMEKYKYLPMCTCTFIISWHVASLFGYVYWPTQLPKEECIETFSFGIGTYISWLWREAFFNKSVHLKMFRMLCDTWKLTWSLSLSSLWLLTL